MLKDLTDEQLIDRLTSTVMARAFCGSMRAYRESLAESDEIRKELLERLSR